MVVVPAPTQNITLANANFLSSTTYYCGVLNSIALNGNLPQYTGEEVRWTQISGPPVQILDSTSSSTTVTGITEFGTYCFKYTIYNSLSNCNSDNVVCYVFNSSGILDAGPNQILPCNVTSATIPTVYTGSGTLNYRIISGPTGAFNYPVNYRTSNVINNLTLPGTYRVEVNYNFGLGCSPVNDFVDITVSRPPSGSNAGSDQNFACASTVTQLAGNDPSLTGFGNGRWSQLSGPNTSTLVTPTNFICNIRNTIPGVYVFRWTISGGNRCTDNFDDIRVVIPDTSISNANAGTDKVICPFSALSLNGNAIRADETVLWTSIPAGVSFSPSNTVVNPIVTGLSTNTIYKFIYTITNSCGSISRDTVQITTSSSAGPSAADAGANQCLPGGTTSIQLNAVAPNSGTGTWSKISGPNAVITNNNLYNTTVSGLTNGTYQFVWKIAVNGCLNTTEDTVNITISPTTSIANAGSDITTCSDNVTMNANIPVNGTGSWVQISGDGDAVINSINNPKTTINNLSSGVYVFRWMISNNACSSNFDDVKVTISLPPSASNAGLDQRLCGANANQTTLQGNTPLSGSGQWVQVSGPSQAIIVNSSNPNTLISNLTNGMYIFRWIIAGGPNCPSSSDEVQISISLPANAGTDQNLCNASSTILTGNIGSNGNWSQTSGPSVTLSQLSGNSNATVSGLTAGSSYTFRYTIPAIFGCPSSFDDVVVNNGTFARVPDAGSDVALCNAVSVALNGSTPGNGETGMWSVLSGPSGATFSPSASNPNASINGMVPGIYILKWTVSNSFCSSSDQKRIENYTSPTNAIAGIDQVVCFEKAILRGNIPSNGVGTWSQISGPVNTTIAAINNPISEVNGLNAIGVYAYVWTITNGPVCTPEIR